MVSDRLMRRVLDSLTDRPLPIRELAKRADMGESNIIRVLHALASLDRATRIKLPRGERMARYGWRKTTIRKED